MFISTTDITDIKVHLKKQCSPNQKHRNCLQLEYVIPILCDWVMQEEQENIYILGTVQNHEKYRPGARVKTSRILSFQSVDGRYLISTRNSIYELGNPMIQLHGDYKKFYQELYQTVSDRKAGPIACDSHLSDVTKLA